MPSLQSLVGSLLDGLSGVVAGIVMYVGVALVAEALESGKSAVNGKAFHFFECVGCLDRDDMMHDVRFHESSLAQATLAKPLAIEL